MATFDQMSFEERFAPMTDARARFVSKVYSGLTASLVLATLTCALGTVWFQTMPIQDAVRISRILGFVELGMILLTFVMRLSGIAGWIWLALFVSITGVTLAPVLIIYEKIAGVGTIAAALGLTAAIFVTLSAYVRYSGKDFSYMGGFLLMGTVGLILAGLLLLFFPSNTVNFWMSCIGALLFSGWILYDTSAISRQYYESDNVVGAILALYLDILNLFLFLLQILGGNRRSRD